MKPTLTTNTNETKGRQRQPARLPAVCQHADAERERPTRCHLDCRGHRPRSRCLRTGKLNSNHIFFFSSLKMTLFHFGFLFSMPFLFFGIVSLLFSPWYFLLKFSFIIQRQLTHIDRRRKRKNNSDSQSHVTAHTHTRGQVLKNKSRILRSDVKRLEYQVVFLTRDHCRSGHIHTSDRYVSKKSKID